MEEKTEDEMELNKEEIEYMKESFDNEIWPKMKSQLKEMSRKESCFTCFMAGYDLSRYSIEEEMKEAKEKLSKMSDEEIRDVIKQDNKNSLWEDKTKVNGVWLDDKTGDALEDGKDDD